MEGSLPGDKVDNVLGCISLVWSTSDDRDHTLEERCFDLLEHSLSEGKWFRVQPFCSIEGPNHLMREIFVVHPLSDGLA